MKLIKLMDQLGAPFDRDADGRHIGKTLAHVVTNAAGAGDGAGFGGGAIPHQRFDTRSWSKDSDGDGKVDAVDPNPFGWD